MRKKCIPRISLITFTLLFVCAAQLSGAEISKPDGYSTSTLSAPAILNSKIGVRSYGMGAAQTGNADDLSSLYYNPAGLAQLNYFEYGLSHQEHGNDVQGHNLLFSAPLPYGTLGVHTSLFTVRDNHYVKNGENINPDRNKYAYIAQLSYGAPIIERRLLAGINVKWFSADFLNSPQVTSYQQQQKGLFFDLGALFYYELSNLRKIFPNASPATFRGLPKVSSGFTVRNIHPVVGFSNEVPYDNAPTEYNFGLSIYYSYRMMLNVDLINSMSNPTQLRYGLEVWPAHFIALRGGMAVAADNSPFRAVHWGIGLGEIVQRNKFSIEYSGSQEYANGFAFDYQVIHKFAFHHNFESIQSMPDKTAPGGVRQVPLRITERYTNQYRFMHEISPGDVIDDSIIAVVDEPLPPDPGTITTDTEEIITPPPVEPKGPKKPVKPPAPIIGKKIVAIFPVTVEVLAGQNTVLELKDRIRGNYLRELNRQASGRPINTSKMAQAPKRNANESEAAYLKRLQAVIGADLIVFAKVIVDGRTGEITVKTIYYKKGDTSLSGFAEIYGKDNATDKLVEEATASFVTNHKSLLQEN